MAPPVKIKLREVLPRGGSISERTLVLYDLDGNRKWDVGLREGDDEVVFHRDWGFIGDVVVDRSVRELIQNPQLLSQKKFIPLHGKEREWIESKMWGGTQLRPPQNHKASNLAEITFAAPLAIAPLLPLAGELVVSKMAQAVGVSAAAHVGAIYLWQDSLQSVQTSPKPRNLEELKVIAATALKKWKDGEEPDLNYGHFFLDVEAHQPRHLDVLELYPVFLEKLFKRQKKYQELAEKTDDLRSIARLERMLGWAFEGLTIFEESASDLLDVLRGRGSNDLAQTKIILDAITHSGLPLPEGYQLGVMRSPKYSQPVFFNPSTGKIIYLVNGVRSENPKTAIYHPSILLKDFLNTQGVPSPVSDSDLLMSGTPGVDYGEILLSKYLRFPHYSREADTAFQAEVVALAQNHLKEWEVTGKTDFDYGDFIVKAELAHDLAEPKSFYRHYSKLWEEHKERALLAKKKRGNWKEEVLAVRETIIQKGELTQYRGRQARFIKYLDGEFGQCLVQGLSFTANMAAAGIQLPDPYIFGLQAYNDHIPLVIYNRESGRVWDLFYNRFYDDIEAPIYHLPYLFYTYLLTAREFSPVDLEDLRIAKRNAPLREEKKSDNEDGIFKSFGGESYSGGISPDMKEIPFGDGKTVENKIYYNGAVPGEHFERPPVFFEGLNTPYVLSGEFGQGLCFSKQEMFDHYLSLPTWEEREAYLVTLYFQFITVQLDNGVFSEVFQGLPKEPEKFGLKEWEFAANALKTISNIAALMGMSVEKGFKEFPRLLLFVEQVEKVTGWYASHPEKLLTMLDQEDELSQIIFTKSLDEIGGFIPEASDALWNSLFDLVSDPTRVGFRNEEESEKLKAENKEDVFLVNFFSSNEEKEEREKPTPQLSREEPDIRIALSTMRRILYSMLLFHPKFRNHHTTLFAAAIFLDTGVSEIQWEEAYIRKDGRKMRVPKTLVSLYKELGY